MRFLKNKIQLAKNNLSYQDKSTSSCTLQPHQNLQNDTLSEQIEQNLSNNSSPSKRSRVPGVTKTSQATLSIKNIVKNYGRKICSFATSELAHPYLEVLLEKNQVNRDDFLQYLNHSKEKINGLFNFRSLLLSNDSDSEEVKGYKRVFRGIGEIFIKYFSVNWIYNSKMVHKRAHLYYRFKMLRRIQCPELFINLRSPKKIEINRGSVVDDKFLKF